MKVEVLHAPQLSAAEQAMCDMHSFRNVLTTIGIELFLLAQELGDPRCLEQAVRSCKAMVQAVSRSPSLDSGPGLADHRNLLAASLESALRNHPVPEPRQAAVDAYVTNLQQLFRVVDAREAELVTWEGSPYRWRTYHVAQLLAGVKMVFTTMAKLSHGRYGIVFSPAEPTPRDFLFDVDIRSVHGESITMPSILSDVLRDLMANSRKYSLPGTRIRARLHDDGERLELEVADQGRGIPADEILAVVNFGTRGTNVKDVPSRGGGFGLTKAVSACSRLGGRTWIESDLGQGTTITLHVPRPATPTTAEAIPDIEQSVA